MPKVIGNLGTHLGQLLNDLETAQVGISADDLSALLSLAKLVEKKGGVAPFVVLADAEVHVGNLTLRLPTIGASAWLRDRLITQAWFQGEPALQLLCKAYAYVHGRHPEQLAKERNEFDLAEELDRWSMSFDLTLEELRDAVDAAESGFPVMSGSALDGDPKLLGTVASLVEQYGQDVDHWLWHQSAQRVAWIGVELSPEKDNKRLTPRDHAYRKLKGLCHEIREKYLGNLAGSPADVVAVPETGMGTESGSVSQVAPPEKSDERELPGTQGGSAGVGDPQADGNEQGPGAR